MTEPFVSKHNSFYVIQDWHEDIPGLVAGFSTKHGGQSTGVFETLNTGFHVKDRPEDVRANRKTIGRLLDFSTDQWVGACQTHGNRIVHVTKQDAGKGALNYDTSLPDTDGLYTEDPGLLLTLCYADCVPLYFLSRKHKRIGTAHAGWKGTVLGIGWNMVKQWEKEGINPEEIEAVIGPSICEQCYQVDERVIEGARRWISGNEPPFTPVSKEEGQFLLSLQKLNEMILQKAGIPKKSIRSTNYCTSCSPEFFSHRRDQGKTGRMIGFIGWKEKV